MSSRACTAWGKIIQLQLAHNLTNPYPLTQNTLCYVVVFLGKLGLSSATVKVYLSALRRQQIERDLPASDHCSMPKLKAVQGGVAKAHLQAVRQVRKRLPITPAILHSIKGAWRESGTSYDSIMLWAICTLEFFGGKTGDDICPVAVVLAFLSIRGQHPGPLFVLGQPSSTEDTSESVQDGRTRWERDRMYSSERPGTISAR